MEAVLCGLCPVVLHTVFSELIMSSLSSFTSGLPVWITCISFLYLIPLVGTSSTALKKMHFFPCFQSGGGEVVNLLQLNGWL